MRRITILDRYVAREVLGPFVLGVGLLTFALVTGRLLKLTEMVVNHGVTLRDVLSLMGFIMPAFLELTFPMAVLLGVLIGFGRMSGDRELIAARACGVSLYRLAVPVLMVAPLVWALSPRFAFPLRPWANARLQDRLFDGSIFGVEQQSNRSHVTSFHIYDLSVRPGEELGVPPREPEELS